MLVSERFFSTHTMPRISEFFGIVIYIYHESAHHHLPHLHAIYAEFEASFSIDSGEILAGSLPGKQARRVSRWIKKRRDELQANWERVTINEELEWIDP